MTDGVGGGPPGPPHNGERLCVAHQLGGGEVLGHGDGGAQSRGASSGQHCPCAKQGGGVSTTSVGPGAGAGGYVAFGDGTFWPQRLSAFRPRYDPFSMLLKMPAIDSCQFCGW